MLIVTGPSGNVGADLTRALMEQGSDAPPFRLAAHSPERLTTELGSAAPVVRFAYDDRATWDGVLDGATSLFLLFPLPKSSTAKRWMVPFVEAAASAGVEHIVYVTVPGADTRRPIPHWHTERAIVRSGAGYTFLRPSYFMQNLVRAISTHGVDIATRDEIYVPAGGSRTTFVDSRDVAQVALRVLTDPPAHRGRSYTLAGAETLDFFEVAEILSEVLGRSISYPKPSMPAFWRRLRGRGVTWDTVAFMTIVYTLARRGRNELHSDDLPRLLGRAPTTFREFAVDNRWRWDTQTWT